MKAIVDCNSFYCSCERLFRPELEHKPVVVLSNNDGCIISRTDEAKKLGIAMTGPYFMAKPLIEKNGVATFSSNYNLYGDLSRRVMETLRLMAGKENVEVYSVDEAFVDMSHAPEKELYQTALNMRLTIEQWTGISVSIGVAPTKVLAKVANRLCKKNKQETNGVIVLDTKEKINEALSKTKVEDIWGVGRRSAEKLQRFAIDDAYQLSQMNEQWMNKNFGGVVGVRLLKELKGEPALDMQEELVQKKMITSTRMFGNPVSDVNDIKEAVATYTSRAAEKLRRQKSAASVVQVLVVEKQPFKNSEHFAHGPMLTRHIILPYATSLTQELIKPALKLAEQLFRPDKFYQKAGVILSGLVPDSTIQGNLFVPPSVNNRRMLMNTIDNINFSMRNDILKFASSGLKRDWKMRQELRSPRYTTRWEELREVN